MSETQEKLSVVMFTGGRGTQSISAALLKYPYVTLTLLVNAYDDGLSTGRLRAFVPGMLGPSDVRKNVSRLIPDDTPSHRALHKLIEHRFPTPFSATKAIEVLKAIRPETTDFPATDLKDAFFSLNLNQVRTLQEWSQQFVTYYDAQAAKGGSFDFGDCSLGNLFFTGCFLQNGKSFNQATIAFAKACDARGRVLNITKGENLVLVGLKRDGAYLPDEAHIVSEQEEGPIQELYLLPFYLKPEEWKGLTHEGLAKRLSEQQQTPALDPEAGEALKHADIIVYGPGTQHSSLFPSYLTEGLAEAVASNNGAEKIFVGNIQKDVEIRHETAETLLEKFFFYLNRKNKLKLPWKDLVTQFFLQDPSYDEKQAANVVQFDPARFPYPANQVVVTNWAGSPTAHSGGRVLDELIRVVSEKTQRKLRPFRHTVSIIVPGLNEARTLRDVLRELTVLDFSALGLAKEIIYIDGGSSDGSVALAESVPDVKVYSVKDAKGRGAALRLGIQKASGDTIAFFPSDAEYRTQDLVSVIHEITRSEFNVVYGSRLIKCVDLSARIRDIYRGNSFLYLTSKYGGMAVSILGLLLFNRFITDPFTSIKAFDARLLKGLNLSSKGFELETELLAKLGLGRQFILEVPVDYQPRSRSEGKKTTVFDGLRSIWKLFTLRFGAA